MRRLGLRGRLMLLGTAGVAATLAVGGVLLVLALKFALLRSLEDTARHTATDVAELAVAGELPDPVPAGGTGAVQLVDGDSRVLAASIGADRLVALLRPADLDRARTGQTITLRGPEGAILVVAQPARGVGTVLVAVSARDAEQTVRALRTTLLIAFPVFLACLAAIAWRLIGATLRPVEEARARQRAFVADAAHELRSPLASLRTQLEVAAHLGEPADPEELLADVARLGRLTDDLLLLARVDERAGTRSEPVELLGLVRGLRGRYPTVTVTGTPQSTTGDRGQLERVVANLVDNGLRHARTQVAVDVTRDGPQVLVTVTDDGPGIPAADRERVFGRFTRLDGARGRDGGGSGLGLAIVRELVAAHNGTVRLTDAGPGLRAEVRLPRLVGPVETADRQPGQ
ncbi:ATP-binding protein [Longispora sp. K20-0274]|uniref:sensor histidine kinase n=1 Tax=Longispora sp. K20-0274 TaxID=3088255 RepID=UPI00399AE2D6